MALVFTGVNHDGGLRAQAAIGFGHNGLIGMPDTAFAGDSVLVGSFIKNYAPLNDSTYFDTIQIVGFVDTTGPSTIPFTLPPVSQLLIAPGDSLFFILPFSFRDYPMGGNFRIGNNVIVVWPISFDPHFATLDSLTANVFVIDTISGMGSEHISGGDVRCYPVPAVGPLYVTSSNHSLKVKEVIVRDGTGRIIAISKTPGLGIDTEPWASGIYLLEITFENGKKSVYKIIR